MPTMNNTTIPARRLAAALEPVIGQVYFAAEAHTAYEGLGFAPSPASLDGLALPDGPAYFTSRGSLMGDVAGNVVAAAFGVFSPVAVIASVDYGWTLTNATAIRFARRQGAVAQLQRVLGVEALGAVEVAGGLLRKAVDPLRPEGRALFAGAQQHFEDGDDPWHRLFQLGDMLREYRGDSHTAAWISAGVDATEINLLSERYMGLELRSYARTRAWSDEQFDAAQQRLCDRGWFDADAQLTDAGRAGREAIEVATDLQLAPALNALGDDLSSLIETLLPFGQSIRAAKGYPGGPADLWPNR